MAWNNIMIAWGQEFCEESAERSGIDYSRLVVFTQWLVWSEGPRMVLLKWLGPCWRLLKGWPHLSPSASPRSFRDSPHRFSSKVIRLLTMVASFLYHEYSKWSRWSLKTWSRNWYSVTYRVIFYPSIHRDKDCWTEEERTLTPPRKESQILCGHF